MNTHSTLKTRIGAVGFEIVILSFHFIVHSGLLKSKENAYRSEFNDDNTCLREWQQESIDNAQES